MCHPYVFCVTLSSPPALELDPLLLRFRDCCIGVGGIEVLRLLAGQLHLRGGVWVMVVRLSESFGEIGYAIEILLVLSWLFLMAVQNRDHSTGLNGS